ncbi:head-tail connector protein [Salinicola sp. JS01]|uniref:head-tail connector protein n=1 Tax=Salinicola sp. JS01 TaxID=3050071 RepID=UPI00255BD4E2|nr:head-tail connector protein [Salinicola sp. JS01]WIX32508.1 head-tail connector protein [Salinicola sp. JS01]
MLTLEEVKAQRRIEADDSSEDELLTQLIAAAYRYAEAHTQTAIRQQQKTVVIDGFPPLDRAVELPWLPVQGIDAVEFVSPAGDTHSLDEQALRLDTRGDPHKLYPRWGDRWPDTIAEPESVTITATVGFAETPDDIKVALHLLIGHWYENRESVVIGTIATDVPMGVDMLLFDYRRHAVG